MAHQGPHVLLRLVEPHTTDLSFTDHDQIEGSLQRVFSLSHGNLSDAFAQHLWSGVALADQDVGPVAHAAAILPLDAVLLPVFPELGPYVWGTQALCDRFGSTGLSPVGQHGRQPSRTRVVGILIAAQAHIPCPGLFQHSHQPINVTPIVVTR